MSHSRGEHSPEYVSELNNLIQIISGTSSLIENIWEGNEGSEKYFAMLRASIERAEQVTAQLAAQVGGAQGKVLLHPELRELAEAISAPCASAPPRACILVVDDEPMALALLRKVFTDAGYAVVCAQSGLECLELLHRDADAYDLVLLDFTMPVMNGLETFERLRRISSRLKVVLTTGFVSADCLDRLLEAGLCGFLRKPFANDEVLSLVRTVLKRSPGTNSMADGIAAAV